MRTLSRRNHICTGMDQIVDKTWRHMDFLCVYPTGQDSELMDRIDAWWQVLVPVWPVSGSDLNWRAKKKTKQTRAVFITWTAFICWQTFFILFLFFLFYFIFFFAVRGPSSLDGLHYFADRQFFLVAIFMTVVVSTTLTSIILTVRGNRSLKLWSNFFFWIVYWKKERKKCIDFRRPAAERVFTIIIKSDQDDFIIKIKRTII
jgi:hypothetical protein